jgi:hypothetical protein
MLSTSSTSPTAGWWLNIYQGAGEASGCFVSSLPRPTGSTFLAAADPARSNQEAARRAKGMVRRYCAANRLNRLGTLTYADEFFQLNRGSMKSVCVPCDDGFEFLLSHCTE